MGKKDTLTTIVGLLFRRNCSVWKVSNLLGGQWQYFFQVGEDERGSQDVLDKDNPSKKQLAR